MSKTDAMLARAARRMRDVPGYVAYDLRRYAELTGVEPAAQLGVDATGMARLVLCRSPRRDRHFLADLRRIADDCGISRVAFANVVRTVDVLTDWSGAAASQPHRALGALREPHPSPAEAGHDDLDRRPRLLVAARDTAEERTVVELPPTGTTAVPRWLARAVELFWGQTPSPHKFPRDLELPLLTGLPVAIVELPGLTVAAMAEWLAQRYLPVLAPVADRRLRACLLAYAGVGLVFVDAADTPAQRRVSLAHEGGHLIVDYLLPRQEVARRRPELLEVLDGAREPTADERMEIAAFDLPIGLHTHLLEHTADGRWRDALASRAEHHVERVALELLAPQQIVLQRAQQASVDTSQELAALLEAEFGLPPGIASGYAGQLAPLQAPRPQGLLGLLDLHEPADPAAGQAQEGPAGDAAPRTPEDHRGSGDESA